MEFSKNQHVENIANCLTDTALGKTRNHRKTFKTNKLCLR